MENAAVSWQISLIEEHIAVENRHLMDEMLATLADEEPVRDEVAGERYVGKYAVARRYAELWQAFPDFRVEPVRFTQQGDVVVMEALYSGTHLGAYAGVIGTGRSFKIRLVNVFTFTSDRIATETIYIDALSQKTQLGLVTESR